MAIVAALHRDVSKDILYSAPAHLWDRSVVATESDVEITINKTKRIGKQTMQDNDKNDGTPSTTNNSGTCNSCNYFHVDELYNGWPPNQPSPSIIPYQHYIWPNTIEPIKQYYVQPGVTTTTAVYPDTILSKMPEAYIKVNGDRRKNHGGKIYLKDGEEFQFEVFNPSTSTLGLAIEIDGALISQSKLVLKPGQRLNLDRYIDDNRKFLYKTYSVEDTKEVKDAIKNNGSIRLLFYKEQLITNGSGTITIANNNNLFNLNGTSNISKGNIGGAFYCSTANDIGDSTRQLNFCSMDNMIETGRTEKGGKSDQTFNSVSMEFSTYIAKVIEFKILPLSQKPIEAKDLIKHCTECGTKLDRKWKFCGSCGHKI